MLFDDRPLFFQEVSGAFQQHGAVTWPTTCTANASHGSFVLVYPRVLPPRIVLFGRSGRIKPDDTPAWRRSPSLDLSVGLSCTQFLATAPSACIGCLQPAPVLNDPMHFDAVDRPIASITHEPIAPTQRRFEMKTRLLTTRRPLLDVRTSRMRHHHN